MEHAQQLDTDRIIRTAHLNDIVTIDLNLTPENGFVPLPLFDTVGSISFVLGWGNYLPGLHTLVEGMHEGESIENVSIDAGWGVRRDDLVVTVLKSELKFIKDISIIEPGCHLHLEGGIQVLVTNVTETAITVDANPPLAGASYRCNLRVLKVESLPSDTMMQHSNLLASPEGSRFHVATFALGCFWGAQLAFSRIPGVVGTKVGFTQGTRSNPTYQEVCEGSTRHCEAVSIVFDPLEVSYTGLLQVALSRLEQTTDALQLAELFASAGDEKSDQYRYGFYYHSEEQRSVAEEFIKVECRFPIEVLPAARFYAAEEYHQHYLLKGGQSSRKGSKETIRCYG